jgi:hypothetical protein
MNIRHLLTGATLLITINFATAQKIFVWFDGGLKAQYGAGGFYNAAIGKSDKFDYTISTGYSFGGKIGINRGYNGLAIDIMRSTAKQEFQDLSSNGAVKSIDWKSWDIYALFRNAANMGYFEIGPKISFIDGVSDNVENNTSVDRSDSYNSNVLSGVIGFGANVMGNEDRFSGILGLRFEYAFTDFVSESGQTASAPLRSSAVYADGYKASNIAFAGVVFELNWGLGFYGKSQCGKRAKFIMF